MLPLCRWVVCSFVFASLPIAAVTQVQGGSRTIDNSDLVQLPASNVHPRVRTATDLGPTRLDRAMQRMVLVLAPRPNAQVQLNAFLADIQDAASPIFHAWVTPAEFGTRFGISDDDMNSVVGWLQSFGFTIDEVPEGRGWVNFSGNVQMVEQAFHVHMHDYLSNGELHHANADAPRIPRALSDVVLGVVSLHDFRRKSMNSGAQALVPDYTSGSAHYIAPGDFAIIYNTQALYSAGLSGGGQSIAVVGRTDIRLSDVQFFRSYFGLPSNDPVFVHNGTDPGDLGGGEETEADLDVEWSGAVAPNATVKLVISASTQTTDGVDLSAQYIVNSSLAPVMTTSFGSCEADMGSSELNFYANLWAQAAAQGITSFISSGDSGAAGCDSGSASRGTVLAVNGLASTPNNVAVGGTQFQDTSNPSQYWSASNSPTGSSVLQYIPERAWNESGSVSGGSGLWATGGGASAKYSKPSWQSAPGVPADGKRDVPDVSLSSAGHDGYLIIQGHTSTSSGLYSVGGTSAASPSFAGIMALVVQSKVARQGNANNTFYPMATAQYGNNAYSAFHDVTAGNNTVPGVTGFNAAVGYDQATGLGSVDANALLQNWGITSIPGDFTISALPNSVSAAQGAGTTSTVTTAVSGGFNNAITLSASGQPAGVTVSFSPQSIIAPGSGTSTMTISVGSTVATGAYTIVVTGSGGSIIHTTSVTLNVTSSTGLWQKLFDFRSTSSFVTDPTNGTWVNEGVPYPTTRNGVTFGWQSGAGVFSRDRSLTVDPRLAGANFAWSNQPPAVFEVDVPAPGTYSLALAIGDDFYGQCPSGCVVQFFDGTTLLATVSVPGVAIGNFADVQGSIWSAAQWPTSNAVRNVTLTGTKLLVKVGANNGADEYTPIAHLAVTEVQ